MDSSLVHSGLNIGTASVGSPTKYGSNGHHADSGTEVIHVETPSGGAKPSTRLLTPLSHALKTQNGHAAGGVGAPVDRTSTGSLHSADRRDSAEGEATRLVPATAASAMTLQPEKHPGKWTLAFILSACRFFAAAFSAYGLYLAIEAMQSSAPWTVQGIAKQILEGFIMFACAITFFGMASSSFFAQRYRLNQAVNKWIDNKKLETPHNSPALFWGSVAPYALQIGFMSVASIVGLSSNWFTFGGATAIGALIGLGYGFLTANYNGLSIEAGDKDLAKMKEQGKPLRVCSGEYWLLLLGNMLPQFAINPYVTAKGIESFSQLAWASAVPLSVSLAFTALSTVSLTRAQQASFIKNIRMEGGMMGKVFGHHAGLSSHDVSWRIRYASKINRAVCNIAVMAMVLSNGNALAQLLQLAVNAILAKTGFETPAKEWFFLYLLVASVPAFINATGYMAFNTADSKLVFDFMLLTTDIRVSCRWSDCRFQIGRIPTVDEMAFFKALFELEDMREMAEANVKNETNLQKSYKVHGSAENRAQVLAYNETRANELKRVSHNLWPLISGDPSKTQELKAVIAAVKAHHKVVPTDKDGEFSVAKLIDYTATVRLGIPVARVSPMAIADSSGSERSLNGNGAHVFGGANPAGSTLNLGQQTVADIV